MKSLTVIGREIIEMSNAQVTAKKIGDDYSELIAFAKYMDNEHFMSVENKNLFALLEKPSKWQAEYDEWRKTGEVKEVR